MNRDIILNRFSPIAVIASKFLFGSILLINLTLFAGPAINRQANSTLQFPQERPVGDFEFILTAGVGEFNFDQPVALATPPGETNRIFVVESGGRIIAVTNLSSPVPTTNLFLDITDRVASDYETKKVEGLTSLAFHPGYQTNGLFYVTYTTVTTTTAGFGNHNRISEFRCSSDPSIALSESEVPFITQIDRGDGHNFNDLHFGPDGYLYASLGDEGDGGFGDDYNNAQRIDKNFFSGMIRIDPDKRPGNPAPNPHAASSGNYAIPADNPFIGATAFNGKPVDPSQVRTEFFAVGLRNPWRFSFDPLTSDIYEGDVGQHSREEINLIVKGGNYGWSFLEGTLNGPKGPVPAGVTVREPLFEYGTSTNIQCVIGGVVYRGTRFPELYGTYIFSDWGTNEVYALRRDAQNSRSIQPLLYASDIVSFGVDPGNGDVLLVNHFGGRIMRLEYRLKGNGQTYPPTLAETGIFSDLQALTPNPGIVPYDVNVPLWSDGAKKQRWFSLPNLTQKISFQPESNWSFPASAVWIKHFELELTPGDPASSHRVETRALVKTAAGVYGVTYRWGNSTSNADLVPEEGLDEPFAINSGGIIRTQIWHYPSRSECLACHTPVAGYVLGFNTPQMNCDFSYPSVRTNQLAALSEANYFDAPITNVHPLRSLAKLQDETSSREYRVRSYLFANCAQCHQPNGPAYANWDARITTPIDAARIIDGLLINPEGDPDNRFVKPGSLAHSIALKRMSTLDKDRMPPLGTRVVDQEAVDLISDWITQDLPSYESFAAWQTRFFGSTDAPSAMANADSDKDGAPNYLEYLTHTDPRNGADSWHIAIDRKPNGVAIHFPQLANRAFVVEGTPSLEPAQWQALDSQSNAPIFTANPTNRIEPDSITGANRFYRVRVISP
jgi:glucose/arabinose dehydrogenase